MRNTRIALVALIGSLVLSGGVAISASIWPASFVYFTDGEQLQEKFDGGDLGGGGSFTPDADPGVDHSGYVAGHGNGADCSAGSYPLGVDAAGAVVGCTDASTEVDSIVAVHAALPNAHHTPTVDTNASTLCTGTDVLNGSGSCVAMGGGGTVTGILADTGGTTTGATITLGTDDALVTTRASDVVTISISPNSIDGTDLATGSVSTLEIVDGTIDILDMGSNSVDSGTIIDGEVALADMAAAARPGTESATGVTKPRTDTDDWIVGDGQCDAGADCLLYDVSTGLLNLASPTDGSGGGIVIQGPDATGASFTLNEAGDSSGGNYWGVTAKTEMTATRTQTVDEYGFAPGGWAYLPARGSGSQQLDADESGFEPFNFDPNNQIIHSSKISSGDFFVCDPSTQASPEYRECTIDANCINNSPTSGACVNYNTVDVLAGTYQITFMTSGVAAGDGNPTSYGECNVAADNTGDICLQDSECPSGACTASSDLIDCTAITLWDNVAGAQVPVYGKFFDGYTSAEQTFVVDFASDVELTAYHATCVTVGTTYFELAPVTIDRSRTGLIIREIVD